MPRAIVFAATGALLLAACASTSPLVTGAVSNTAPGANPGIVVDSPVATGTGQTQLGAVEGGLMGADVGRSLTDADRKLALKAEYEALEYGRSGSRSQWQSRTTGVHGEISVGSTYQVNSLDCREYHHKVYIGGRARVVNGTGCRQPNGVWRIVG